VHAALLTRASLQPHNAPSPIRLLRTFDRSPFPFDASAGEVHTKQEPSRACRRRTNSTVPNTTSRFGRRLILSNESRANLLLSFGTLSLVSISAEFAENNTSTEPVSF